MHRRSLRLVIVLVLSLLVVIAALPTQAYEWKTDYTFHEDSNFDPVAVEFYEGKLLFSNISDDTGGENAGIVNIYSHDGIGNWTLDGTLTPAVPVAGAQFGRHIIVNREDGTITVTNSQGKIYIFTPDGVGGFTETSVTTSATPIISLAVDDGIIVAGLAYFNDNIGKVEVFTPDDVGGYDVDTLTASDGVNLDYFGGSVAIENGMIVVGASNDWSATTVAGKAYRYEPNGSGYDEYIMNGTGLTMGAQFGSSVAIANGEIFVGAPTHDGHGGALHIFTPDGVGGYTEAIKYGEWSSRLGSDIELDGDTMAVGAVWQGPENKQGGIYLYRKIAGDWTLDDIMNDSAGGNWCQFGADVAIENLFVASYSSSVCFTVTVLYPVPDAPPTNAVANGASQIDLTWEAQDGALSYIVERFEGGSWTPIATGLTVTNFSDTGLSCNTNYMYQVLAVGDYGNSDPSNTASATTGSCTVPTNTPGGPTATPTPTATLEPGVTELIVNGGFENLGGDGKPEIAPWGIKNGDGDKATCNKDKDGDGVADKIVAATGNCAFKFKNVLGEGKVRQSLDLSGIVPTVGDTVTLSFYAQSSGGATVRAKVIFTYADTTKTKFNLESTASEIYTQFTDTDSLTRTDIVNSKIVFKSTQTGGKAYVDDVSLLHTASGLIAVPGAALRRNS